MKKRLNTTVLTVADIALTTSDGLAGRKIRMVTGSPISHAMLYVTHSSVVHAVREGVYAENTQGIFFEENAPVYVLRLKGGLPPSQAERICDHVRRTVGTQYSIREAIQSGFGRGAEATAKQFCSRLVAQAYQASGYHLVADPNYCTPHDFLKSDLLEEVNNCTQPVSDAEFEFWQGSDMSPVDHSMESLHQVLAYVRKIDPSVQSFQDIGRFVMNNSEHDRAVNDLLESSGYLSGWQHDLNEHPWRYDIAKIRHMSGIEIYCLSTMKGEARDNNRYTKSLAGLRADYKRCPRDTLASLIKLYERLVEQHAKRMDAAAFWLAQEREKSV